MIEVDKGGQKDVHNRNNKTGISEVECWGLHFLRSPDRCR